MEPTESTHSREPAGDPAASPRTQTLQGVPRKRVWLIGAGASISHSRGVFPTLEGIPAAAAKYGVLKTPGEGYAELLRYVSARFRVDLRRGPKVDLERVLTTLDIDIEVRPEAWLLHAREQLLLFLRDTIDELHSAAAIAPVNAEHGVGEYYRLARRLGPSDTVITFNWDLLLDDALGRIDALSSAGDADVSVKPSGRWVFPAMEQGDGPYTAFVQRLTGWGEWSRQSLVPPSPEPTSGARNVGYYLKAHGSADWYYCTVPTCRASGRVFPLLFSETRPREDLACGACGERSELLIVPPTLNKRLRELPVLRRLWTLAAREIDVADEVLVWGYSLPATDFFSEWLLRQGRRHWPRTLVIINPAVCQGSSNRRVDFGFVGRFVDALRTELDDLSITLFESYGDYERGTSADQKYPRVAADIAKLGRAGRSR
jgi:hypothetical protein